MTARVHRSGRARLIEPVCRILLAAAEFATRRRLAVSTIGLALTLVLGLTYMIFGALGVDPTAATTTVRVQLADSGGLLPGQNVALRGVPIGHVAAVDITRDGLVATATFDAGTRIPAGGHVAVKTLSMAGEQYLDFEPDRDGGPYLADGAVIPVANTSTPAPLWKTLTSMEGTLAQIDPARLAGIIGELGVGPEGPRKLGEIIDGGTFLISTLDSVLPQTVSLLRDSRTVLTTVADAGPGLREVATDTDSVMRGAAGMNDGFRTLVGATPAMLTTIDAVIADNSPTMVQLLGNLLTVGQMAYVRIPAFQEFFFPRGRAGSTLGALADEAIHDGGIWGIVSLYPRPTCDFDHPRRQPSRPDLPLPYLYTSCPDNDPSVLIRGARNAPRPPGERDPAVAPPGREQAQASPTPIGPQSFPLTYGGPPPTDPPK
ncbi:MCE family protein MceF [Nocardia nova SH22a]|uniref:MCE family protein MceF n=1 Tax=Nocardia nova SH22a TaxID=1415166 RepID=W5TFH3_9NOCA|nr:MCE family protein [Nocardia nova]AHH17758.1 MCE family protein MceF [Nocardia nova SH22a]